MSIQHFQRTVWSTSFIRTLETITSMRNHCSYKYQKDTENAKEVKMLSVNRPTVKKYVPGTKIVREGASDSSLTLKLDQYRYFNFEVEDIDKAQSVPGLMEELSEEACRGLSLEGDKYVAEIIKTAADDADSEVSCSSLITLTNSNAMASVEAGFTVLYEHNCKVNDTFYLEVAPKVFTTYRQQLTELSTNNPEILKKGAVGKVNNALVCIENCLAEGDDAYYNVLRTDRAVAFAEQIDKVEAYRPQDAFTDALKGLYVFGAKIVRPKEIYVMKTKKSA
ncbi:MAG: hypothetical protein IJO73_02380 [Clostridia bacterium]|nr:hypothetical protein [Clostridia bacterium]